jgi:hypothetical protein
MLSIMSLGIGISFVRGRFFGSILGFIGGLIGEMFIRLICAPIGGLFTRPAGLARTVFG